MQLTVTAPAFDTEDVRGNRLSMSDFRGKRVLLSFYRNAACALCNLQIHKLIHKFPVYRTRGLEIVAIFESPRENVLRYVGQQEPPFPLVADPHARLYELYGVRNSEMKVREATRSLRSGRLGQLVLEAASAGFPLTEEPGSNFFRMPADFLIDPEGLIHAAHYAEVIGTHIPDEEIEGFLAGAAAGFAR